MNFILKFENVVSCKFHLEICKCCLVQIKFTLDALFCLDGLFQLLMEIATNSGPDYVLDGLSLTSLACSALISLVVALGETGKLMTALSAMLMGTGPLSTQKIQVLYIKLFACWVIFMLLLSSAGSFFKINFLAHLSRRLMGELIVYQSLRYPSVVCPSVNIFKHLLL